MGAGIFFVGYALFEIPSNIILHYVGARRWLSRIMVTWGIVAACFAWATTQTSFLCLRVLLGICEAGFFPGIIYFFTFWFTARRRSGIMGMLLFGTPICFIFGSPFSGFLMDLDGVLGVHGWQWLFVVEGLMASLVGVWAWWYLTDRPQDATWITQDEKDALRAELAQEDSVKAEAHIGALKVLANPKVWFLCVIYFMMQISTYGVVFYLPTQVAGLMGRKVGFLVGVVSAIPWVFALIATATIPRYSDRSGKRGSLASVLIVCSGFGIMASALNAPFWAIVGLCVAVSGLYPVSAIFWTMPARFLTGVGAASAIALINSLGNLGGFLAPNLRVWAEKFFQDPSAGIFAVASASFVAAVFFLITILWGMGKNTERLSQAK
jgi:predicted MFS family arabinose efflux permease